MHFDVIKTKTYGYFNGALHRLGRAELGSFWLISHWVGKLLTSSFMHSQPSLWAKAVFITASKAALLGVVLKLKQDNEDSEFVEVARKKTFFDMVFELYLLDVIQVVTKQSRGNC